MSSYSVCPRTLKGLPAAHPRERLVVALPQALQVLAQAVARPALGIPSWVDHQAPEVSALASSACRRDPSAEVEEPWVAHQARAVDPHVEARHRD